MSITTLDKLGQRRGAAVLLEVLRSEGARYIIGNPGTTELPLIDALVDAPDISYVWALQEASAVAMADGYAQAAGRPGVLNLHTAGGLGHGLGNLLNASVAIDFLALAASMGVPGRRVERAADIAPAIEAGIASGALRI
jgi:benzoylformate decarboxylase